MLKKKPTYKHSSKGATANKLSDYALIGNSRTSALVSKLGSIDWCCLPEFDSPSIFAALLDRERGGYFSICPLADYNSSQRYLPDTNVVETAFETEEGQARILDAFTAMDEEAKTHSLFPDHEVLRVVEGISGAVRFKMEYVPRTFYGKSHPQLHDQQKLGIHFTWKQHVYVLLSTLTQQQYSLSQDKGRAVAEFVVQQGEQVVFSLSYSSQSPAIIPEIRTTAWKRMQDTMRYWKKWIGSCQYSGLYEEQVKRSALTLKLLTHAPSGAIIAAPTTSLPEEVGGVRNWDYRYCWLRDASFTTRVLVKLGFEAEAHAYMNWILHATQLTRPKLQVVYSVFGHASIKERTLHWLNGYRSSRPVRIGNGADTQLQLDVYGEVLDALYTYAPLAKRFDRDTRKFIIALGKVICKHWEQPDNGIWEVRTKLVHHTHSKVMCWVGLDRIIKLCEQFNWDNAPLEKFKSTATRIKNCVEEQGYSKELESYTRALNGNTLDASLLTLSLVGYCNAASPRMASTTAQIAAQLAKNGLIFRYLQVDDGLSGDEGSFSICNFWLAENLAKAGKLKQAVKIFDNMLSHGSPTGLFSEEIDPHSHELVGNYPQGFTHIGLINAALSINEASKKGTDAI